jgi:type II secretory ATPase GspE/PulE/Tfp pilus assembly ATPase PilB-like protein
MYPIITNLLLSSVEYGGYISIVKFVVFLVLFFLWLFTLNRVHRDAEAIKTNSRFWSGIVLATGGLSAVIWLLVPVFVIGLLFYLIVVGIGVVGYIKHRNSQVMEFERVFTAEHIKGFILRTEQKELDALKDFAFITANDNEVPMPQPKTPLFFGYKIAHDLLNDAIWRRASSINLSPQKEEYGVTYQVDGAALKQQNMDNNQVGYLIHFVKNLADLDMKERRKPQKGNFRTRREKENIKWEVKTAGSTAGEVIRFKPITQAEMMKLDDLGLTPEQLEQISKMRQAKQGLFIFSGPKKSGVTTTFYTLLQNHDAFLNSIDILERHPLTNLPNVTQNVYTLSDSGGTTYGKKLQSIVEMGPDIIGAADCDDSETARVASEAAQEGKLVYVTIQAEGVLNTLAKWIKLVGDRDLAIDNLIGLSSQKLLRILCQECKQAYRPDTELLKKFNLPADKAKVLHREGREHYDKHGKPTTCNNCQGTGFVGRMGVFETIILTDELRNAIKRAKSLPEINKRLRSARMVYLQEHTLKKVIEGVTSINEMVRLFATSKKRKERKRAKNSS